MMERELWNTDRQEVGQMAPASTVRRTITVS